MSAAKWEGDRFEAAAARTRLGEVMLQACRAVLVDGEPAKDAAEQHAVSKQAVYQAKRRIEAADLAIATEQRGGVTITTLPGQRPPGAEPEPEGAAHLDVGGAERSPGEAPDLAVALHAAARACEALAAALAAHPEAAEAVRERLRASDGLAPLGDFSATSEEQQRESDYAEAFGDPWRECHECGAKQWRDRRLGRTKCPRGYCPWYVQA